ncbi:hypothetical protein QYE76_019169 [Lolium multiflorum]|uniref:CCHC-type domain-containing protein n=1 Tax=Lolium multiflorum TaxID=4521 RepID=A0AAD8VMV3_LOLMU|nr:hypothetical protein QYE76_019169 [Lolium multiflorum]
MIVSGLIWRLFIFSSPRCSITVFREHRIPVIILIFFILFHHNPSFSVLGPKIIAGHETDPKQVAVKGFRGRVFGECSGATTGITTSSDDEFLHTDNFFPDLSDFFDNLNMGDNDAAVKQINSSSVAAATRPPLFDGMHYKRWRTKAVLWFTNLGCFSATDARPEGPLSAEEQEKFEKVDAMFKAALFSILGDNIVDPYMAFDHGKDAWDALEAKFGVSDAGTELYVMEQYYDYRMTDERSVVEQAHEIQSLAKELEQFKCTLPDKFVAEKARAKDTHARSFEGGSSANVVQKKNFQSHKSKNKNNGKGKFDEKNKASNSTNFKRKTPYKKKGNCHVCGAPGHWAPDCPERHDRRGNSGKSANVVIGVDTEMKDVGYGRKDFLRADGKRLTCFCSWCCSLRRRLRLPHPVRRRAPTAGTVGLRNPASREPVRVRGNQVLGSAPATTGITTSSSDDEFLHTDNFFPDLSDFFDNLNMGDNDAAKCDLFIYLTSLHD